MSCIQNIGKHHSPQNVGYHTHTGYQLILVLSGEAEFNIGSSFYKVAEPSVVVIGNLKPHRIVTKSEIYERYVVNLSAAELVSSIKNEMLLSIFFNSADGCVIPVKKIASELVVLFEMLIEEHNSDDSVPNSESWILRTMLLRLFRHSKESFSGTDDNIGPIVRQVAKILHNNIGEDISLDSIAKSLHISKYYISHCFSEQVGYSILRYRLLLKIAVARELLETTEKSVSEICAEVGFSGMSNFSRYFKRETGFTPSEYRKRIKTEKI